MRAARRDPACGWPERDRVPGIRLRLHAWAFLLAGPLLLLDWVTEPTLLAVRFADPGRAGGSAQSTRSRQPGPAHPRAVSPAWLSRRIDGIKVSGTGAFLAATEDALALLRPTREYPAICRSLARIRQGRRSGVSCWLKYPDFEVGERTWNSGSAWYAGSIAHDAHHVMLYREAAREHPEADPIRASSGKRAEQACIGYQLAVLREIGADEHLIADCEEGRKNPTYQGDPYSWADYEKRDW
jgi:hypothetical protein